MRACELIEKKKQGKPLTGAEIEWAVRTYTSGEMPDYQMSALLMAICLRGMNEEETAALTAAMRDSGDRVDLSRFGGKTVDKHSTGGVGDKTTLIVAPLVASLGAKVAKMSGRGLDFTGGTVDKLESIPGYRGTLTEEEFLRQVEEIGIAVIGQSADLAPADKKMYALRDVTATVDSIPLIVSSIMSKKLAAGTDHIVLDVTCGNGAFMQTLPEAETLAREMVKIGKACKKSTAALITSMEEPLGFAVGNALEVLESIEVLQNKGPEDLREVSLALASKMLSLCHGWTAEESRSKAEEALANGSAYAKFEQWIARQGGHLDRLPTARFSHTVLSEESGYVTGIDARTVGRASVLLGAGRAVKDDPIDPSAGVMLHAKTGDFVAAGQPLATLYASDATRPEVAQLLLKSAFHRADTPKPPQPTVYKSVE